MPPKALDDNLVVTLTEQTLTLPAADREAYLRGACNGDAELFRQVWKYVDAEVRMNGFLKDPVLPRAWMQHPFEPGELVEGRFRIVRIAGEGGMSWVYEAVDEKLDRRIAIKCAKLGFQRRLPPEVDNARKITHPNVCKIFDIHTARTEHGEIDFITMEFLEGPTLAQRLKDGPLPPEEARRIALQLCAGLVEAHRERVIHGDLKSGNVILTTADGGVTRAVITDFGLARVNQESRPGKPAEPQGGTPGYMAPELGKGEKASVASDIFALGAILFELASGHLPAQPAPGSHEWLGWKPAATHSKWDTILKRCLDPDPSRRFANAAAVARAVSPPPTLRWILTAAAAAVLAAVILLFSYRSITAPPERVRLAVLPFAQEKLLRDVMDQVGGVKGNRHTAIKVIPLNAVLQGHVDSAAKAGNMLGATHVLRGTIERKKDQLTLHAFLTDAHTGTDVRERIGDYSAAEERYIPGFVASLVTDAFHLPPPAKAGEVNAAARNDYLAGLASLRRDSTIPAALASFERVVQADPDSALPWAGMAEAQWFRYFLTKERTWLDQSAESLRQAERRNLDLAQVHRVAGLHLANGGGYEQASEEYHRAIELEPKEAENYRRLGHVYELNHQKGEALAAFQTAVSLQPDYYRAHYELGAYHYNHGDYAAAVAPFRKAVDLAPDEPDVRFALGASYLNLGMYGDAEQQSRLAVTLNDGPNALHSLGLTLMYQARDQEAIAYFLQALHRNPKSYLSWMYLGIAYRRTNRTAESADANRRGRELTEAEMARNPKAGFVRSIRGYLAARLGDQARAESETAQALNLAPDDAETRWMAILTYEALHQREASLAVLNTSSRLQLMDITRWPDVADLSHDSRFLQLLATLKLK